MWITASPSTTCSSSTRSPHPAVGLWRYTHNVHSIVMCFKLYVTYLLCTLHCTFTLRTIVCPILKSGLGLLCRILCSMSPCSGVLETLLTTSQLNNWHTHRSRHTSDMVYHVILFYMIHMGWVLTNETLHWECFYVHEKSTVMVRPRSLDSSLGSRPSLYMRVLIVCKQTTWIQRIPPPHN